MDTLDFNSIFMEFLSNYGFKFMVNDATCVQNSIHVDLFWVFDS